ncbi:MAG: ABC transporter ATP-binding protein [Christensenellaceae bacterium]|jgi:ATP-binding cassette subfamily B multidrug efflux pump
MKLKRVLNLLRPYKTQIIFAFVAALVSVGLSLLGPVLIGQAVDVIIGQNNVAFQKLISILIWFAVTLIISAAAQWLVSLLTNRIVFLATKELRIAAIEKINRTPIRYIDTHAHGDVVNRVVSDITQIGDGLIQGLTQLFTGVVTILGTLCFMLSINALIALVVVVMTPLSILAASFIVRQTNKYYMSQSEIQGNLTGHLNEMVQNQKILTTFQCQAGAIHTFEEIDEKLHEIGVKAQLYSSLANPVTRFVNGLVYTAVALIGAISAIRGGLSIGQISSFLSYANQYTKPFNEVSGVVGQIQTAIASANRVFDLLDQPEETDAPEDIMLDNAIIKGDITVEGITFSYTPEQSLIEDLSFSVKAGQKVAIVGPTGSGKTTFVNLLMRFYELNAGKILLDGNDIFHIQRNNLRGQFGMVLQDTWLSTGTIAENIAYGKPDASREEIIEAAVSARAHNFIMRLAKGYDTVISNKDSNLSEGQRQLLSIARIMLENPPMLILDEATSNIDTRTEQYIQEAFDKMMEGRTSFVVAHRLSTIESADLILVLKDGQVVEQGTHQNLLAEQGFYASLYNSQFAATA